MSTKRVDYTYSLLLAVEMIFKYECCIMKCFFINDTLNKVEHAIAYRC